jgi:uncharacterized protein YjbI with pentapeptide repeats
MADAEQLTILAEQGVEAWNSWRRDHPPARVDLSGTPFRETYLAGVNLSKANLRDVDLTDAWLTGADLEGADLGKARADGANFANANLRGANLRGATLSGAVMTKARLVRADLTGTHLNRANLDDADLSGASMARSQLRQTNLVRAQLTDADLEGADASAARMNRAALRGASLEGTYLIETDLGRADLTGANLRGAQLEKTSLVGTRLHGADLTGARVYGISTWDIEHNELTVQSGLVITPTFTPEITVDDLDAAQFLYMLLENRRLRDLLDGVSAKAVLILGRFGDERRGALAALRKALGDRYQLVPIGFDLPRPLTTEVTDRVKRLASVCRFVIVDLADAPDLPQELAGVVGDASDVPVQPIVPAAQREYGMFEPWAKIAHVLPDLSYRDGAELLELLDSGVVRPTREWAETHDVPAVRERRLRETVRAKEAEIAALKATSGNR